MSNDPVQPQHKRRGIMMVISSPSGAGKTTLCQRLINEVPGVKLSVSATTRAMRPNEMQDKDYHFCSADEFKRMIGNDEFLEWARVFDNYYGTPKARVDAVLEAGIDVIFDVDWQGARALKTLRAGDVISAFILPPSIEKLRARLAGRPGASQQAIETRLAGAGTDILRWGEYDYAVVNDDLERCFTDLKSILLAERVRRTRASLGVMVDKLLADSPRA